LSLDQCLIGKPFSSRAGHEAIETVKGVALYVPLVKPEGELINVAAKVFLAGMVVYADQAALENRENALNAVCGHVIADKFAFTVIDCIVIEKHAADACICSGLVGMQDRSDFHMPMNFGLDGSRVRVRNRRCDRSPASLAHPKNWRLPDCAATGLELLVFVLVGLDSTDETFIDFDNSAQLLEVTAAGFAQPTFA
jgi:hypothetical protein